MLSVVSCSFNARMALHPMQWLLFVLGVCCCSAAAAAALNDAYAIGFYSEKPDDEPQCINTFLACRAQCSELQLKLQHHQPVQDVLVIDRTISMLLVFMVAATLAATLQAVRATRMLCAAQQVFATREAELLRRCQGITDQAFDLAEKLQAQTPTPKGDCRMPLGIQADPQGAWRKASPLLVQAPDVQPYSAASTPPAPSSDSLAPNLALLVAEAAPARDTSGNSTDQHSSLSGMGAASINAVKLAGSHSAAGVDRLAVPQPRTPPSPNQVKLPLPHHASAGKSLQQHSSPHGLYTSPKQSPAAVAPPSASQCLLPGGPRPLAGHAGSPAVVSPTGPYNGPAAGAGNMQWRGSPTGGLSQTPWPQQPQQPPQASSCPPFPGVGGGSTPLGPILPAQGVAPHSAGQLRLVTPGRSDQQQVPDCPAPGSSFGATMREQQLGWVNTSRGSGTPLPFNGMMAPGSVQPAPGASPLASPLCTPATASTTRSGGSLTHVQSMHSTAGSCGGSVKAPAGTPATPLSAGSAVSNAAASTPGRPKYDEINSLISRLDELKKASSVKKQKAQRNLKEFAEEGNRKRAEGQTPPICQRR